MREMFAISGDEDSAIVIRGDMCEGVAKE